MIDVLVTVGVAIDQDPVMIMISMFDVLDVACRLSCRRRSL